MNKKLLLGSIITAVLMSVTIVNMNVSELKYDSGLTLANIEALTEEASETKCETNCLDGGCGESQCSLDCYDMVTGKHIDISTTAASGYYACCYEASSGTYYARCFKNSCCN
jgi:hypothetical protein